MKPTQTGSAVYVKVGDWYKSNDMTMADQIALVRAQCANIPDSPPALRLVE